MQAHFRSQYAGNLWYIETCTILERLALDALLHVATVTTFYTFLAKSWRYGALIFLPLILYLLL